MPGEKKLQASQNAITNCIIILCLAVANPNSVNGELYFDTHHNALYIYYNGWVQVLYTLII